MEQDDLINRVKTEYKKDIELANTLLEKSTSWLRYLVTTVSVVFGVLVSLGSNNSSMSIQTRCCFAVSVVLLALSILLLGVCLYSEIYYLRKGIILHAEETRKAYREARQQEPVSVPTKKIFVVCEATGYICFGLALLAWCVFVFLPIIFP